VYLATLKPENGHLERKAIQAALDLVDGSFAKAGKNLGVNRGTLYAIMKGKRHASNSVRAAIGLPPHTVAVVPPDCGHVTLVDVCPVCNPPKPKRKRPVERVVRVARVDDARLRVLGILHSARRNVWGNIYLQS